MPDFYTVLMLVGFGFLGAFINAIVGGGGLITVPALLAVGLLVEAGELPFQDAVDVLGLLLLLQLDQVLRVAGPPPGAGTGSAGCAY